MPNVTPSQAVTNKNREGVIALPSTVTYTILAPPPSVRKSRMWSQLVGVFSFVFGIFVLTKVSGVYRLSLHRCKLYDFHFQKTILLACLPFLFFIYFFLFQSLESTFFFFWFLFNLFLFFYFCGVSNDDVSRVAWQPPVYFSWIEFRCLFISISIV